MSTGEGTTEPPGEDVARREQGESGTEEQGELVFEQVIRQAAMQGPLPPPQWVNQYEQVLPGAADRIFTLAEKEQDQRHWGQRAYIYFRFATLVVAAIVAMTAIVGGIYLIANGKSATGISIILADLVAVLVVFLVRQFTTNGNGSS